MNIFSYTDEALENEHDLLLKQELSYERLIDKLLDYVRAFPDTAMAWPSVTKRKGDGIEINIKAVKARAPEECATYKASMQWTGRPPSFVVHKRVIRGDLIEIARLALATIRAAKTISEVLTVLEETKCPDSTEPTDT